MKVEVITFQDWRKNKFPSDQVVVTVSKSTTWSKGLSPFFLGPCSLYDNYIAKNVENAWQYSKVYSEFMDGDVVSDRYYTWAKRGWEADSAHRYPMGKDARPLFSIWKKNGETVRLSYVEARKGIYIPLYYKAVKDTEAFSNLKAKYEELKAKEQDLYLVDFDAYRHHASGKSYTDVINNPLRKMGHAFVLAMALEIPNELEKAIGNR